MSVGAGGPREGADVPEALVQAAHGSELPPPVSRGSRPPINQLEAPRVTVSCGTRVVVWERAAYLCSCG